jgi:hypothetical protein
MTPGSLLEDLHGQLEAALASAGHPVQLILQDRPPAVSHRGAQLWVALIDQEGELELAISANPTAAPVALLVRLADDPHGGQVMSGDPAFDGRYHVEGAPAELIRALLDEPTRALVRQALPTSIDLDGTLVVTMSFAITELSGDSIPRRVAAGLDLAAGLVSRLPGLADEPAGHPPAGDPFRGGVDAAAHAARRVRLARELQEFRRLRTSRQRRATVGCLVALALAIAAAVWLVRAC